MTRHAFTLTLGLVALAFAVGLAIGRATLAGALDRQSHEIDLCRDSIGEIMREP